jgi:hypothetical protein
MNDPTKRAREASIQLALINEMSEEDWDTLRELTALLIDVLASDSGAAVLMADRKGDGTGCVHAIGNQRLIPALMASAAMAAHAMFEKPEGVSFQ